MFAIRPSIGWCLLSLKPGVRHSQVFQSARCYASKQPIDSATPLPHVAEEAAALDEIMHPGRTAPDPAKQGVRIEEILEQDAAAQKNAPSVLQPKDKDAAEKLSCISIPQREDPVLAQFVNLVMRDGKKQRAQTMVQKALEYVRKRTGVPDPTLSLKECVEKVSPLVRMVSKKQGSKQIMRPIPLFQRQRYRRGFLWILDASSKRTSIREFNVRLGEELVAVINGTSSVFQKREQLHKLAFLNRGNASVR